MRLLTFLYGFIKPKKRAARKTTAKDSSLTPLPSADKSLWADKTRGHPIRCRLNFLDDDDRASLKSFHSSADSDISFVGSLEGSSQISLTLSTASSESMPGQDSKTPTGTSADQSISMEYMEEQSSGSRLRKLE